MRSTTGFAVLRAWATCIFFLTTTTVDAQQISTVSGTIRSTVTASLPTLSITATQSATSSEVPDTTSVQTATPSVTGGEDSPLPSQAALPPVQTWCPSQIFCAGEILQTINIAQPYADSKTIVDKPTNGTAQSVIAAFNALKQQGVTYGEVVDLLEQSFQGEGLELEANPLENFPTSPQAFQSIPDPYVKGFALAVHNIWNLLIRDTDESRICTSGRCESSLIPLNHTFVVPGGRFREQYYWDSKFILDGLLKSELYSVAKSTLDNFMDEIEQFGFIPNGGRIYYLNRSQPPVFTTMMLSYYNATRDAETLLRALPILEKELTWWDTNRSLNIVSPYTNQTRLVYHYAVKNSAPRPESYREDYRAANGDDLETPYTDEQKAALYAELASGAETGWDYSSRWAKDHSVATDHADQMPILRTLNVRNTTAVDLNAILYKARIDLATLYDLSAATLAKGVLRRDGSNRAEHHRDAANKLRATVLDLFWDADRLGFYDFNLTSNARNEQLTAAHWYPLWAGIIPDEVKRNETAAFGTYSSLNLVNRKFNGTIPATFVTTGLQWDFPNAWPPHIFFALEALTNVPKNVSSSPIPSAPQDNSWNLLPPNHLGISEDALPLQTTDGNNTAPRGTDLNALNGTVFNGGNATEGEGWVKQLQREVANRYFTSVFCSWYATGGELPGLLPRLDNSTLNLTSSVDQNGHLFEKFSALDVDSAGRGGEYAVQAGFGWTNGVLLWIASEFKDVLVRPTCPQITVESTGNQQTNSEGGAEKLVTVNALGMGLVTSLLVLVGLAL